MKVLIMLVLCLTVLGCGRRGERIHNIKGLDPDQLNIVKNKFDIDIIALNLNMRNKRDIKPICRSIEGCLKICEYFDKAKCKQLSIDKVLAFWMNQISMYSKWEQARNDLNLIATQPSVSDFLSNVDKDNNVVEALFSLSVAANCPINEKPDILYSYSPYVSLYLGAPEVDEEADVDAEAVAAVEALEAAKAEEAAAAVEALGAAKAKELAAEQALVAAKAEVTAAEETLAAAKAARDDLVADPNAIPPEVEAAEANLASLKTALENAKAKVVAAEQALVAAKAEVAAAEEVLAAAAAETSPVEAAETSAAPPQEEALVAAKAEVAAAQEALASAKAAKDVLAADVSASPPDWKAAEKSVASAQEALEAAEAKLAAVQEAAEAEANADQPAANAEADDTEMEQQMQVSTKKKIMDGQMLYFNLPVFAGYIKKCFGFESKTFSQMALEIENEKAFDLGDKVISKACSENSECIRLAYCAIDSEVVWKNLKQSIKEAGCDYEGFSEMLP